jgi:hypothetical protein
MKSSSVFKALCAALLLVITSANHVFADEAPTFSDPDVTAFCKDYAKFVDDYSEAYKASKAGDNSKLSDLQTKSQDLQTKAAQVAGKVKPDEAQKFQTYISSIMQKLLDVAKQQQ